MLDAPSIFLSTPSARRATLNACCFFSGVRPISIHALREEGDDVQSYDRSTELISIHALREEGDFWMLSYCCCKTISIHALREEGDHPAGILPDSRADFYPRPPRGGRQRDVLGTFATPGISIHALREEGDAEGLVYDMFDRKFLSTPSARRATCTSWTASLSTRFLSTPSARRATLQCLVTWSSHRYFYPRPPRGGRPATSRAR